MSKQEPSTRIESAPPGSSGEEPSTLGHFEILTIVGVVLALVGGFIVFFTTTICDEQATEAGAVLTVCRHLRATDPPVVAFGIVIAVLLSRFFSEISYSPNGLSSFRTASASAGTKSRRGLSYRNAYAASRRPRSSCWR